jgi:hypothetical protein
MFDTIKVSLPTSPPSPDSLTVRQFTLSYGQSARGCKWMRAKRAPGEGEPSLTWFINETGPAMLMAEVSLSNLWHRLTGKQIDEGSILHAVNNFSERVSLLAGISFDAADAKVNRLDFYADFRVGEENITPIIEAALAATPAHLEPVKWASSTAYFRSPARGRELILYGKLKDALHKKPKESVEQWRGIVRLESRFRNARSCRYLAERLGLPESKAKHLLSTSAWEVVMNQALQALHFDRVTPSRDDRMKLLLEKYGGRAAELYGALCFRELLGNDFWKAMGWSPSKYHRKRKELIAANVWTSTPISSSIPRLQLVKPIKVKAA